MKADYIKKIHKWGRSHKENKKLPIGNLTKDIDSFKYALELLYKVGENCGIIEGDYYIYKRNVTPVKEAITPDDAVLLVRAGVIKQCPPKPFAYILFPYSGTALEIRKISKSFVKAAKFFQGEVTEANYTAKSALFEGDNFIIDYPLNFE